MKLILNENLEKLHRYKIHKMYLIGANDSFLFFTDDSEHKDGVVALSKELGFEVITEGIITV